MNDILTSVTLDSANMIPYVEEYPSVALTTSTGLVFVKKADILYCLAENSYTNVYLKGGRKVTVSKHLKRMSYGFL